MLVLDWVIPCMLMTGYQDRPFLGLSDGELLDGGRTSRSIVTSRRRAGYSEEGHCESKLCYPCTTLETRLEGHTVLAYNPLGACSCPANLSRHISSLFPGPGQSQRSSRPSDIRTSVLDSIACPLQRACRPSNFLKCALLLPQHCP